MKCIQRYVYTLKSQVSQLLDWCGGRLLTPVYPGTRIDLNTQEYP
jgi:hypothetical protein